MWSGSFWRDTAERAVKTFAHQALSVSGGAALLSVLTSLASTRVGDPDSPSLVAK